ncbi:hypothetical protein [Nocardia sp. NPDC050793]
MNHQRLGFHDQEHSIMLHLVPIEGCEEGGKIGNDDHRRAARDLMWS